MLTPWSGRQVCVSVVLRPLLGFLAAPQIVHLLSNKLVYSLSTKPQVSTKLHYTITIVEARELNLKYARATGELNTRPSTLAAECITTTPLIPLHATGFMTAVASESH